MSQQQASNDPLNGLHASLNAMMISDEQTAAPGSSLPSTTAVASGGSAPQYTSERSFVPTGAHTKAAVGAIVAERLPTFVSLCHTGVPEDHLDGAQGLRKLLSIESNPPIDEIIETGVTAKLLSFLDSDDHRLVYEAAWALTNIASGTSVHTRHLESLGAIPRFIALVSHPSTDVAEQAVWAIGNIAGDSTYFRDLCLRLGALKPVLAVAQESSRLSTLRNATWTLSNLCRGKPQPRFDTVSAALPTLARLIYATDNEVITDALWALSYLSDGENARIQSVIEAGIVRRVVELLNHASHAVKTPALRTIGNIVTGDDRQTQVVLNCGLMAIIPTLLRDPKIGIRKETCWAVSNLTAGNVQQIQAVVDSGVIPAILAIMREPGSWDVRKEACWAVSNATSSADRAQSKYLVEHGTLEALAYLAAAPDPRIVNVCIEGIQNLFRIGASMSDDGSNAYVDRLQPTTEWINVLRIAQESKKSSRGNQAVDALFEEFLPDFNVLAMQLPEPESSSSSGGSSQQKTRFGGFGAPSAPGGPSMMNNDSYNDDDDAMSD